MIKKNIQLTVFFIVLLYVGGNIIACFGMDIVKSNEEINKSEFYSIVIERDDNANIFSFKPSIDYWLQTTNSDFNNGTKNNITVGGDAFYLNETYYNYNSTIIDNESFEDNWPPINWEETGNWNQENNQVHTGKYSADFDGQFLGRSGNLITPKIDCSNESVESITVEFWGYSQEADKGEYFLDYYNGKTWNEIRRLDNFGRYKWQKYNHTITDIQYFVPDFRMRWRVINLGFWEHVYVDDVTIIIEKNESGYVPRGNLVSEIHDTTQIEPVYTNISLNSSIPNGTTIFTWVRSAENETAINSSTWYLEISQVPYKRYVQWRINLSGDKGNTPIVYSVNISWYYEDIPQPTITYVDDDYNSSTTGWNYDHFNNIQNGINAVVENGTVYVFNGSYYEFVFINKRIDLLGEHEKGTIIDGGGGSDVIYISDDSINISKFTITNSGGTPIGYAAIRILSNKCNISYNIIKNNYHGIYLLLPFIVKYDLS